MSTNKRKLIIISLMTIIVIALGTAIFLLIKNQVEEAGIEQMEKETISSFILESPEETPDTNIEEDTPESPEATSTGGTNTDGYVFNWNGLTSTNSDVIGWIRFNNPSRINYPVVQRSNSNQFYLNHDWQGRYRSSGAIFMHKDNASNFTDANSIIYGHRMNGGSMFGALTKYQSQSFMNNNPYFYIYTPDGEKRTYEVILIAEVQDASYAYSTGFATKEEKVQYFDTMKQKAMCSRNVELDEYSTIVSLSTCSYRGINRLMLQGKLINKEFNQIP